MRIGGVAVTQRRPWSIAALLLALAALVLAAGSAISHFPGGFAVLLCLVPAGAAAWFGVLRRGVPRTLGLGAALLLVSAAVVIVIVERRLLEDLLVTAALLAMLAAARLAFRVHAELGPAKPPSHPVVFYNPRSGGGKAARFNLPAEARRRGIEPIELRPGDDLERLVREAIERGADGLAAAGGDGTQAIVAKLAAEAGLPYACIPAGTRNHFALDLGVDRDDVVGALDAFVDGGERIVDLATVNGQVFVNNVSLGLYADAVRQMGYREAKLHTLLDTVPSVLGPGANAPSLRWQSPHGQQSGVAILISNNAYRLGRVLGSGTRPRLDQGVLGVTVLVPIATNGSGAGRRTLTMQQWTAGAFDVSAGGPTNAGIDGEAVVLGPTLHFRTLPKSLRVRIARGHPGASPSAVEPEGLSQTVRALVGIALRGEDARDTRTRRGRR